MGRDKRRAQHNNVAEDEKHPLAQFKDHVPNANRASGEASVAQHLLELADDVRTMKKLPAPPPDVEFVRFQNVLKDGQDYRISSTSHDGKASRAQKFVFWVQIANKSNDAKTVVLGDDGLPVLDEQGHTIAVATPWEKRAKVSYEIFPIGINGYWFKTSKHYVLLEFFM